MKHWGFAHIVVLWVTGIFIYVIGHSALAWAVESYGYSAAQLRQIALWRIIASALLGLTLLVVTWRWLNVQISSKGAE